jgi:hypothetical protein
VGQIPVGDPGQNYSGANTVNRPAALSKRLSYGGRDKAERGEPTHSPDQQLHHAALFPVLSAMAPDTRDRAERASVKREHRRLPAGSHTPEKDHVYGDRTVPLAIQRPAAMRIRNTIGAPIRKGHGSQQRALLSRKMRRGEGHQPLDTNAPLGAAPHGMRPA